MQDFENDCKYNFEKGFAVFAMCVVHRHPLTKIIDKLMRVCGKNLVDVLPKKCVYVMNMINKGANLMC